ncbi:MAG: SRPBCC family protein [Candidatus Kariarchaeaceae archaeon]|jgi:hypothetical protein
MKLITSIEINASPEDVWNVLMDTDQYHQWNPFILRLEGEKSLGEKLEVELKNGEGTMKFTPKVIEMQEKEHFAWKGIMFLPRLFDGSHHFELAKTESGTRLTHWEEFKGIFVWPIMKMIGKQTENNFIAMNEALKEHVEKSI